MSFFETLAGLATRRPVSICVIALAIAIIGYLSWEQRPIDLLPDLQSPTIVVSVRAGDRPPLEIERLFGERLERQLFTVRGIREIEQVARTGRLVATVLFDWNADVDIGLIDVQKAVGSIEGDPAVDEVLVRRFDPRQDPILEMGLLSTNDNQSLLELRQIARRQLGTNLEQLEGIADVHVLGGRTKEIRVSVDRYRMDAYGITLSTLADSINSQNIDIAAGTVEENNRVYQLRGRARYETPVDVANVVLRYIPTPGGARRAIRIQDIATVTEEPQEIDHLVLVNGREGVGISIYKEAGANTVEVARTIRDAIDNVADDLPNVEIYEVSDNAKLVVDALDDLQIAAIVGILLAVVVLVIFLRSAGATLIVATAVPVSICTALFFMHLGDYSLNIITLGGLALGAGMLVDNAIVVVESMFRRLQAGDDPKLAAQVGTGQVAGAITASTLTTCVVFLPVFFVQGLAVRLIDGIAFTVVVSLIASLFVAVFLIPALGQWFLPRITSLPDADETAKGAVRRGLEAFVARLLNHAFIVIVIATLFVGGAIYGLVQLGTELLPPSDPKQFSVRVVGPAGQRVESTSRMVEGLEAVIRDATSHQVAATLSEVGRIPDDDRVIRQEMSDEHTARVIVRVYDSGPTGRDVALALSEAVEFDDTTLDWEINRSALSDALGSSGVPVLVEISGTALEDIRLATTVVRDRLEKLAPLWNVRSSFEGGPPELHVELDRSLADAAGVNLANISNALQSSLDGRTVTQIAIGDEEYPIVVRGETPYREELESVVMSLGNGRQISMSEVAKFTEIEGAREIFRRDQRRTAQVTAQLAEGFDLPQALAEVQTELDELVLPGGVQVKIRGEEIERAKTFGELQLAGILAIALVFMVLAGTFESLLQPITVLTAIPLALVGVAIAVIPLDQPIGVMNMLGLIVLAGVAVNDAVLLLTTARQLMAGGMKRDEALYRAAGIRLRPITMTTLTTALALTPLLFGGGEGAVLRQPMALTIIGGIVTSTVGSLLVLPCLYRLLDDLGNWLSSFGRSPSQTPAVTSA
ncbi:MAG: efflux RND transporter permease subunit [Gammaproteobacteria bacterium]|nr:efflux RND transporter permease subunit [Gammaproteobacteria bacterium]